MPKPNPSNKGLHYWGDKPIERIRETCGDPVEDEIRGILIGFKATLDARSGYLDMITRTQACDEIKELIVKCGGDPTRLI